MPEVNWDNVEEAEGNYNPLPDGWYLCEVVNVTEKQTQKGDDMWNFEMKVTDGEYVGKKLWDNIVFSDKAMPRAKLICSRFGLKTIGVQNITPETFMGRRAWVQTYIDSYVDKDEKEQKKNSIVFDGYKLVDEAPDTDTAKTDNDDLPF